MVSPVLGVFIPVVVLLVVGFVGGALSGWDAAWLGYAFIASVAVFFALLLAPSASTEREEESG